MAVMDTNTGQQQRAPVGKSTVTAAAVAECFSTTIYNKLQENTISDLPMRETETKISQPSLQGAKYDTLASATVRQCTTNHTRNAAFVFKQAGR